MLIKTMKDNIFKEYAKVINIDVEDLLEAMKNDDIESNYTNYIPSDTTLENHQKVQEISKIVYSEEEFIAGKCFGRSHDILGLEYHNSSEVLLALTDFIYVVGHRWDMEGNYYDSKNLEAFLIPKGTVIEVYSTTLHYNLLNANDTPYYAICILPKGTGDPLKYGRNGILKKRNKWFIAHASNIAKIQDGDFAGLTGEVFRLESLYN